MFTGIVEQTGEVVDVRDDEGGRRLRVRADLADLQHGQSIAINGACLTVEEHGSDDAGTWFEVFCSRETIERTYFDAVSEGDAVNIERALAADGRFDGHLVQGHVDGVGEVTAIERLGDDWEFRFSVPEELGRYCVEKGSIAVDGISLTIADLATGDFGVAVIPATYELTTLSAKSVGDPVHIEVDVVAKYVERLLGAEGGPDTASQTPYAERFDAE
jgi:riboflavin synthase